MSVAKTFLEAKTMHAAACLEWEKNNNKYQEIIREGHMSQELYWA